ncbi:MAG: AAA family ATPase [Alphaproteobacteria bacterium]
MENLTILTGAPGSGKSTVLTLLKERGFACVDEPARQILAEQRRFGGAGVPDRDPRLFTELLLSRHLADYGRMGGRDDLVFFDRGVSDVVEYGKWYGLDVAHMEEAGRCYRYASTVFVMPDWPEIYSQDDERTMTYDEARRFGDGVRRAYQASGYDLVELPRCSAEERVEYILSQLTAGR